MKNEIASKLNDLIDFMQENQSSYIPKSWEEEFQKKKDELFGLIYKSQYEQSEQKKDVVDWKKVWDEYRYETNNEDAWCFFDWLQSHYAIPSSRTVSEEEMERMAIDFANWLDKLTPSQKTSVWSKNGEHRGLFTMDNEQLFEKFKNKGLSLSSPKEEKEVADSLWIDVNEKMPESGQCVLLYSPKSGVGEGAWISAKGHFEQWRWNAIMTNVSHWMPLPSNPKATN